MKTHHVEVDPDLARDLYRKYKQHAAYSKPIDWEIQRTYQLLSQGRVVIRALTSVAAAGTDAHGLPKLALAPATARACHLRRFADGSMQMAASEWPRDDNPHLFKWPAGTMVFPLETFPRTRFDPARRTTDDRRQAPMPLIPVHLRPKRGLANYHVLWEAEWHPIPPRDPYLLRRIGKADLWLVVAHWDLTDVEVAALATRVAS